MAFFTLFGFGFSDKAPRESGDFFSPDLVELIDVDVTFKLDMQDPTTNNFVGGVVYTESRAFLQRPAAIALGCCARGIKNFGVWSYNLRRS